MKNRWKNKMETAILRAKNFFADEKGEGHLLAVVIVAVVVATLALTFRNELKSIITGLIDKMKVAAGQI